MAEIDDEIRLYTGGLRASMTVSTNHSGKAINTLLLLLRDEWKLTHTLVN
jgi:hypothetical protein